jgi:hypothetical protein
MACCSEIDDEIEGRIFAFLEVTLRFIVRTLPSGFDPLLVLLHEIFCDQSHFYANCSGAGACEDISDLVDASGTEVYDDDSIIQVFIYFSASAAELNPKMIAGLSTLAAELRLK